MKVQLKPYSEMWSGRAYRNMVEEFRRDALAGFVVLFWACIAFGSAIGVFFIFVLIAWWFVRTFNWYIFVMAAAIIVFLLLLAAMGRLARKSHLWDNW